MSDFQAPSSRLLALPPQLHSLAALAAMLERVERGGARLDPSQYRLLVERIREELRPRSLDTALGGLLDAFPATAEIYENLRYEWAGLCRSPLEQSAQGERLALQALRRVASPSS